MTSDPRGHRRIRAAAGFTLLELIVVLGVLGVLVGSAIPLASAMIDADRRREVVAELQAIGEALDACWYDRAAFPVGLDDPAFLGVYLQPGIGGTAIVDGWGGDQGYVYAVDPVAGRATVHSRGENGWDDGLAAEEFAVVVHAAVPGLRRTRERMRLIVEVLAGFLEAGGTLSGNWTTDRVALGLGVGYQADGFGTAFTLDPTTLTLRSAGPDRTPGNADDLTN